MPCRHTLPGWKPEYGHDLDCAEADPEQVRRTRELLAWLRDPEVRRIGKTIGRLNPRMPDDLAELRRLAGIWREQEGLPGPDVNRLLDATPELVEIAALFAPVGDGTIWGGLPEEVRSAAVGLIMAVDGNGAGTRAADEARNRLIAAVRPLVHEVSRLNAEVERLAPFEQHAQDLARGVADLRLENEALTEQRDRFAGGLTGATNDRDKLAAEVTRLRAASRDERLPPIPAQEPLPDLIRRELRDAFAKGAWAAQERDLLTAGEYADLHAPRVATAVRVAGAGTLAETATDSLTPAPSFPLGERATDSMTSAPKKEDSDA